MRGTGLGKKAKAGASADPYASCILADKQIMQRQVANAVDGDLKIRMRQAGRAGWGGSGVFSGAE